MLKVNDRVVVKDHSGNPTNCQNGDKGTVKQIPYRGATIRVELDNGGTCAMFEHRFELLGHKHKDVIIRWAKGAEIEVRAFGGRWIVTESPDWCRSLEYRVKPELTEQQLEIKRIEEEMRKLAEDLHKLQGGN